MSDSFSIEFNETPSGGHPHDLLARLYREIGISAVAAALEVSHFPQIAEPAPLRDDRAGAPVLLGDDLAA